MACFSRGSVSVDEAAGENGEERREHDDNKEEIALVHCWRPFVRDSGVEATPSGSRQSSGLLILRWTPEFRPPFGGTQEVPSSR